MQGNLFCLIVKMVGVQLALPGEHADTHEAGDNYTKD